MRTLVASIVTCIALLLTGCAHLASSSQSNGAILPATATTKPSPIKHIVILVQENRSFDDLFARFPGADGATQGTMSNGEVVPLLKGDLVQYGVAHVHATFLTEWDGGKMDRFDRANAGIHHVQQMIGRYNYRYVDPQQIQPYWTMAKQYVLADHMFPTQSSGSFTAHQDLIRGGTALSRWASVIDDPTNNPWGCDAPYGTVTQLINFKKVELRGAGPFPCFTWNTLADLVERAGLTWRYYTPNICCAGGVLWSAFDAIDAVRHSDQWKTNVISPPTEVFRVARRGSLPSVTWVIPRVHDSDHPGGGPDTGPEWVARVVDAIGEGPHWNSTAIIIVWDDWGGLYDHVPPPQLDYQGLGIRVPMLVISPYAKKGFISHTQYEFGSILKFVENNFQLGTLGTTDQRATSIVDCFDFNQKPRKFVPISARLPEAYFIHEPNTNEPVDEQ
ncbi:MAG TPA: alkaline phosphatase family protein [Candidatus Baltobacteraceae bacterium]|nr:alkaline phosphatase family protein [Candidatus Baltobacteraceae bacterium]